MEKFYIIIFLFHTGNWEININKFFLIHCLNKMNFVKTFSKKVTTKQSFPVPFRTLLAMTGSRTLYTIVYIIQPPKIPQPKDTFYGPFKLFC